MSPVRATVIIDGGSVTLMPKRAPVGSSGPIRGHSLAIFAGQPPASQLAGADGPFQATVEPGAQPGFAILDLDEAKAAALGRTLGLAKILFWDGRRAQVVPCAGAVE
jgi:hypothetical protein